MEYSYQENTQDAHDWNQKNFRFRAPTPKSSSNAVNEAAAHYKWLTGCWEDVGNYNRLTTEHLGNVLQFLYGQTPVGDPRPSGWMNTLTGERWDGVAPCDLQASLNRIRAESDAATHRAYVTEPESMTIGQLNQAVRDLREKLYQTELRVQKAEAVADSLYIEPAPRSKTLSVTNKTWAAWDKYRPNSWRA